MGRYLTLLFVCAAQLVLYADELGTIAHVKECAASNKEASFELTGTVILPCGEFHSRLAIESGNDACLFYYGSHNVSKDFQPGDRIRIKGFTSNTFPYLKHAELISHGRRPIPENASAGDILHGKFNWKLISVHGHVLGIFRDEIDLDWVYVVLQCNDGIVYASYRLPRPNEIDSLQLVGAEVEVIGFCTPAGPRPRRLISHILHLAGPSAIRVCHHSQKNDPFNVPTLDLHDIFLALDSNTNTRRQISGRVIALWGNGNLLLKTSNGATVKISCTGDASPTYGMNIQVSGFPETDLYRINLSRACWKTLPQAVANEPQPICIPISQLYHTHEGNSGINPDYFGQAIKVSGVVRGCSDTASGTTLSLESDGYLLSVISGRSDIIHNRIEIGSTVEATGIVYLDTESWRPNAPFPHIREVFLIARTPDDIRTLASPPWWTPLRLSIVIILLLICITLSILWSFILKRLAEKRGHALAAEQLAHVTSELKVNERTRLAVELHDALSQTLTGVSMQIDTAAGFAEGKMPTISRCLAIASRTIDACRMELRNTLWDLRGAALDEPSMDSAIRKTLCQNLAGIDLSVRFNVPRETFSDNTAHAILKIIRELATNALRHGKATALRIAGTIDDGRLLFSVKDNGCGFDPDLAPGISQGHFGLQGITERLERLNGEMKIDSAPGKGAKVTIVLPIPRSGE